MVSRYRSEKTSKQVPVRVSLWAAEHPGYRVRAKGLVDQTTILPSRCRGRTSLHRNAYSPHSRCQPLAVSAPDKQYLTCTELARAILDWTCLRSGLEGRPLAAMGASDQAGAVGCAGGTVRGPHEGETHSQAWPTSAQAEPRTLFAAPQVGSHSLAISECQAADERPRVS